MAGFGAAKGKSSPAKKGPAKKQLSPKRQWDIYRELIGNGEQPGTVYAGLPDGKWIACGQVVSESPGTVAQAAQLHKRLILEHAVRCNPALSPVKKQLTCGIENADGSPELLGKQTLPEGLRAGYYGTPDTASGYYVTYGAASEAFTGKGKKAGLGGY